ncbi:ATP-grasp domain-containing protein [Tumebacillus sp. DT12]|uniref:ATP-grasp domain-containing protein n=1 Tax=Tumebacillus lacus TaxID=2995335 RepID=A0ABT3WYU8_9BACL|nr:ATP-grasp domain-containing protein [Tumebacillus lacus]MCX7569853.1 ATP-grasp domain-containing protein [Tumebacillus lacus]
MNGKRILIMNRWPDDFADYEKIVDHKENTVFYIVNADGKLGLTAGPEDIAKLIEVENIEDIDVLDAACREIIDEFGGIDRLIAGSEFDLIQAATIRTRFGIEGIQEHQVAMYRDKVAMKVRMKREGMRVPHFLDCEDAEGVLTFAAEVGYPLILKPKAGAASQGVHKVDDEETLRSLLPTLDFTDYECEEFVEGTIYHVDGLVYKGEFQFVKVSAYINTCLEFNYGKPLGSYTLQHGPVNDLLEDFTAKTLQALELTDSAFHLEIIMKNEVEPVFLEIGARVGGGEITYLYKEMYGIDMVTQWMKIDAGQFTGVTLKEDAPKYGGFLMIPQPMGEASEVVAAKSLMGEIPTMIGEILPKVGQQFTGKGGYLDINGRYMFAGDTLEDVVRDIHATIDNALVETKPVEEACAIS